MAILTFLFVIGFVLAFIFLSPRLFMPQTKVEYREMVKKQAGIVLGYIIFFFVINLIFGLSSDYGPDGAFVMMMTNGIIFLSVLTGIKAIKAFEVFETQIQELKDLKHGDKDTLDSKAQEIKRMQSDLDDFQKRLDTKNNEIIAKEKELNTRHLELETQKLNIESIQKNLNSKDADFDRRLSNAVTLKEQELVKVYDDKIRKHEEKLRIERDRIQEEYNKKLTEYTDRLTQKYEKRIQSEKSALVDDVFKFDGIDDEDFFELKKSKEEVEKSKMFLEMDQKIFSAKEHALDAKKSALEVKSEHTELRADMKVMASDFKMELLKENSDRVRAQDELLHKLELEQQERQKSNMDIAHRLELLKEQNLSKFKELQHYFERELQNVQIETKENFLEIRRSMDDLKLQFGQEILRLDGQQQNILVELEKYYNKNREYVHQCQSLALEARMQNIEGGKLLNQINTLHKQHQLDTREVSLNLKHSLDEIVLKEGEFANSVNHAMLRLDRTSENNHLALKDIALQRKGLEIAYQTKEQEHKFNLQEIKYQRDELKKTRKLQQLEQDQKEAAWNDAVAHDRMILQKQRDQFNYAVNLERASRSSYHLNKMMG